MSEEVKSALKLSSDPAKLVLDAMEGFFRPHLRKGSWEYEGNVVRSSCVLLLEQLLELKPKIKKAVKEEARTLAGVWREKMRLESGNYMVVLGFLLLVAVYLLWWDFDKEEIRILCEDVQQHRVVGELQSRLGFLQKCGVSSRASQAQKNEPCSPPGKNVFVSPSMDPSIDLCTLCKGMDGKTLQIFLNDRINEQTSMGEEVQSALKLSSDPAKLVLDALEGFFHPHLKKDNMKCEGIVVRSSCVLLLEQLMELKPEITKAVREEAKALAGIWREKMRAESGNYMVVLGFLLLVAVYLLWWDFDTEEIGSLCEIVRQHRVVGELHSRLGFLQKCGVSSKSSQAQENEPYTPPVQKVPSTDPAIELCALCRGVDGKALQMFLNDRIDEQTFMVEEVQSALKLSSDPAKLVLDAMEGFFHPHLKKDNMEYEGDVVRSSCVLLLEQLMELKPEIKKALREEARALAIVWRKKMRAEGGSYMVVLGFLLLVAVYWLWYDFEKDEFGSLFVVVQQHKVVGELHSRLGFLQKCGVSSVASQAQKAEPYTPPVKNVFVSPSTDPSIELCTLCKGMDANGLKSFLMKHVKDLKLYHEKVLDCLRSASDPANLVYNVVQDFYLELNEFQDDTNISCCSFLLEQLMKLSPRINYVLKEEIMNFAACWKARLAMESTNPFIVFGFLKFLAAYRLSSSFQADEILSLFDIFCDKGDIYGFEQIPGLCRALGLEAKIPDHIQSLIKEKKRLEAVRYICAFNLVGKFPPDPLLKAYLAYTEAAALEMCKKFNNSVKAQNKCAKKQISALQNVIRCIYDFNLDSEYSPLQRIRQLELEKEERKSSKLEKKKSRKQKRSAPTAPCADQTHLLQGCSQEKRPRTDTVEESVSPNVSVPEASNVN
ncbi:FRIGIDA-like protein 5 isoform X2 [Spinacia oleracea]|nr:FRIGIDA-like protein 5 isoform X2 [Spinacia oleracea]